MKCRHLGLEAPTASLSCAPYIQLPQLCPNYPSHGPVTLAASTCRCHHAANHKLVPAWREPLRWLHLSPPVTSPEPPHVGCESCAMRKNVSVNGWSCIGCEGFDAHVHVPSPKSASYNNCLLLWFCRFLISDSYYEYHLMVKYPYEYEWQPMASTKPHAGFTQSLVLAFTVGFWNGKQRWKTGKEGWSTSHEVCRAWP